jgi:RNAse (barnase) inhibitor barstar
MIPYHPEYTTQNIDAMLWDILGTQRHETLIFWYHKLMQTKMALNGKRACPLA